ncbi:MAG: hypothetical protein Faunusvirus10_13 [Faunusvirus sp.]|jgi:hypothetical protein|uniref:Uncharacterized protein n=1 Tax=Faunusvirus sp. TaxID=2487766 RepID=A0A3G4ZWY1_9VIRU|nr:MAG: hypothetical protein Faunusvirus10_13 [Faunusvirus sp.]
MFVSRVKLSILCGIAIFVMYHSIAHKRETNSIAYYEQKLVKLDKVQSTPLDQIFRGYYQAKIDIIKMKPQYHDDACALYALRRVGYEVYDNDTLGYCLAVIGLDTRDVIDIVLDNNSSILIQYTTEILDSR